MKNGCGIKTTAVFLLGFIYFFDKIHDLFVAGPNFLYRNIMIDDVNDTCKVFAHVCLDIV